MRKLASIVIVCMFSMPAVAAECIFYKDANRGGESFGQGVSLISPYKLVAPWDDAISSIWVQDGFYALVAEHPRHQGNQIYLYGNGLAFSKNTWFKDKGAAASGGFWYNLEPFAINDLSSSVLCLKE